MARKKKVSKKVAAKKRGPKPGAKRKLDVNELAAQLAVAGFGEMMKQDLEAESYATFCCVVAQHVADYKKSTVKEQID